MTAHHNGTTGQVYYAKPLPIVASPWNGDDVALSETGTSGWFSFENDPTKAYAIYRRIGASPASSDEVVAQVEAGVSQSGDAFARLGAPAGASIAADIAAIEGGGGGFTSVTVVPLTGVVESRVNGTTIKLFVGETPTVAIAVRDAQGEVVDVAELSLQIVVERTSLLDVSVIANSSITKTGSTISFAVPSGLTTTEGSYIWSLRKTGDSSVLMQGPFVVTYAARVDA